MWLLPLLEQLNMHDMKDLGCAISASDIYNINHSSLKDAIVIFDRGCTGEIVSADGLLFTNHHCGYSQIQSHSSIEHDYLKDGFWAMSPEQELPNPGLEVQFLLRIEDVSDRIEKEVSGYLSEDDRRSKEDQVISKIEREASDSNKFEASVKPYYAGNKYYLCVYQVFKDIRLVGTPPSSIGKFGYDSDNWEWPRHSGDFSIFRVYTSPDGKPADYAPGNIPLKSKYYFPLSLGGIQKGDFTMVLGYPGQTDRYLTSYSIKEILEETNPNRIKIRSARQEILKSDMQSDPKIGIQYASKFSTSSNYWKFSIGQNLGIRKLQVIEKKQKEEIDFQNWVNADTVRKATYGTVLDDIQSTTNEQRPYWHNVQYIEEALFQACEVFNFANKFNYLEQLLQKDGRTQQEITEETTALSESANLFYRDYNPVTDIRVVKKMLRLYMENTSPEQRPEFYKSIKDNYGGNSDKFVDKMFHKSIFCNKEKLSTFLNNPSEKVLSKDPGFEVAKSTLTKFYDDCYQYQKFESKLEDLQRLYLKGIMEMKPDKKYYSDANFTMRLTYGTVEDYKPRDAVLYSYYTTLKGVLEKEDTSNFEFRIPARLKNLYYNKDFGPYGEKDYMPVCFTTNNDITGGNSGSPVLNAKGEMIGLAFDGNWEAMSGDLVYEPELQRCICVDIRYVLFIIDKFAGAKNIINELKIIP
jgi:hypothetical protein